jgi:hypothetical protein
MCAGLYLSPVTGKQRFRAAILFKPQRRRLPAIAERQTGDLDEEEKSAEAVFLLTLTGSCFINKHNLF